MKAMGLIDPTLKICFGYVSLPIATMAKKIINPFNIQLFLLFTFQNQHFQPLFLLMPFPRYSIIRYGVALSSCFRIPAFSAFWRRVAPIVSKR